MGKYTLAARRAIEGQQVKMAEGGMTPYDNNMMMQRRGYTSAPMQGQFIAPDPNILGGQLPSQMPRGFESNNTISMAQGGAVRGFQEGGDAGGRRKRRRNYNTTTRKPCKCND
jgi:hypothetical protein